MGLSTGSTTVTEQLASGSLPAAAARPPTPPNTHTHQPRPATAHGLAPSRGQGSPPSPNDAAPIRERAGGKREGCAWGARQRAGRGRARAVEGAAVVDGEHRRGGRRLRGAQGDGRRGRVRNVGRALGVRIAAHARPGGAVRDRTAGEADTTAAESWARRDERGSLTSVGRDEDNALGEPVR
jgi:hypothetical protein